MNIVQVISWITLLVYVVVSTFIFMIGIMKSAVDIRNNKPGILEIIFNLIILFFACFAWIFISGFTISKEFLNQYLETRRE